MKDLRTYISRRVIVETDTLTFSGVIARTTASTIELEHVESLAENGERTPVDGVIVVPAARVAWVQVP